jgi:hypothetical protein
MTNEAADALNLADAQDREIMLAAVRHRKKLAQSDDESIFTIASRLRQQLAEARAAAAKKPATDTVLSDTDRLALHRPGWRVADARRKKFEQRDPEGREAGTITEEEDDSGVYRHDRRRKEATAHMRDPVEEEALSDALSDCERARNEYIDHVTSAYKNPR